MIKEPMLAGSAEGQQLNTLLPHLTRLLKNESGLISMKLNGHRVIVDDREKGIHLYARSGKLVQNEATQNHFGRAELLGLDGEIIVGPPNVETVWNATSSGIKTIRFDPKATFYVFDDFTKPQLPYEERFKLLAKRVAKLNAAGVRVSLVPHFPVKNIAQIVAHNKKFLRGGFEGIMWRSLDGPYKEGRSTLDEGWLLKAKPRENFEAECIGFVEGKTNNNTATTNELGRSQRSSQKAGFTGRGTLGALICKELPDGAVFQVGTGVGIDERTKAALWKVRGTLIGRTIYGTKLAVGEKDKPLSPQMPGSQFRDIV